MTKEIINQESEDKLTSILSGVSGEYFVAAELSRKGYIASITLRNTKGVDILASNSDASRSVAIQVKTNQGSKRYWIMNNKAERFHSENHFYIFVNLNGMSDPPKYYIVPSKIVAEYVISSHANWLANPGKNGKKRSDSTMRKFYDNEEKFLNRWDLLFL